MFRVQNLYNIIKCIKYVYWHSNFEYGDFFFPPILHQSTHALSVSKQLWQGGKTDLCTGVNTIHAYVKLFVLLLN